MERIRKIFAWFQIVTGAIGVVFFGGMALMDIHPFYRFGGFAAMYGLFFYVPISLWFLIAGFLLLRRNLFGTIMSSFTAIFVGMNIFLFIIKPVFLLPSQSTQDTLIENLKNIQLVRKVEVFSLSTIDTLGIHLYCDSKTLDNDRYINEVVAKALQITKEKCPKAKNYSYVRIIFHALEQPNANFIDLWFVYDRNLDGFVKNRGKFKF